jgi:hypothetical protein
MTTISGGDCPKTRQIWQERRRANDSFEGNINRRASSVPFGQDTPIHGIELGGTRQDPWLIPTTSKIPPPALQFFAPKSITQADPHLPLKSPHYGAYLHMI